MDPAGPRSPSVAGLRDLRASVLTNGCDWLTKSRREAGLSRNRCTSGGGRGVPCGSG